MIGALILNDIRYIKKDPMYIIVFILPIILGFIYRSLVIDIECIRPYSYVAQYLLICSTPMMVGMILGFRLLDEKDERVLSVYAVSPLGIKGYMTYRILQCIILSLIELIVLALFGILTKYNFILNIIIGVLLSLFIFLLLSIVGKNKIQGMTILKLSGMVIMLPGLQIIAKNKWDIFFKIIPTDFILTSTFIDSKSFVGILYIFEILAVTLIMINYFYWKCIKDI